MFLGKNKYGEINNRTVKKYEIPVYKLDFK